MENARRASCVEIRASDPPRSARSLLKHSSKTIARQNAWSACADRCAQSEKLICADFTTSPKAVRCAPTASCTVARRLFFEDQIDAHDGGENQLPERIVRRNLVRNLQDVIVGAGEQLFADAGPFFRHVGQFLVA